MRKILSALLISLLLFSTLTSCSLLEKGEEEKPYERVYPTEVTFLGSYSDYEGVSARLVSYDLGSATDKRSQYFTLEIINESDEDIVYFPWFYFTRLYDEGFGSNIGPGYLERFHLYKTEENVRILESNSSVTLNSNEDLVFEDYYGYDIAPGVYRFELHTSNYYESKYLYTDQLIVSVAVEFK